MEPIGPFLDGADLVVEPFDEAESNFVVGVAVGNDAVPVVFDQPGELLVGPQALPFEGIAPVVEEVQGPAGASIAPELTERLFEQVGFVQTLVGMEK